MKAIRLEEPKQLVEVVIDEARSPGPGEVQVATHAVGVCGTDIGGYLEQGGAFPAQFNGQQIVQSEVRLGVTGVAELTPQTTLSGTVEIAHRSGTRSRVHSSSAAR